MASIVAAAVEHDDKGKGCKKPSSTIPPVFRSVFACINIFYIQIVDSFYEWSFRH